MIPRLAIESLLIALIGGWGGPWGRPAPTPPSQHPGQEGERVWVAARNSGTVWIIQPETGRIEGDVSPLRGDPPEGLAAGDGAIWVADFSGWVHRVDAVSRKITATSRGFAYAAEIAVSPSEV